MFAIVEIKGQQFKVEPDQKLFVLNIKGVKAGDEITCDKVLLVNNDGAVVVGTPVVEGAKVVLEVVHTSDEYDENGKAYTKGPKIKVFHKIRRKGFDKLTGARQHFTQVLVKSIVA